MAKRRAAIGLRYVTRFHCTGPDCPESCCNVGWNILVDEGHYRRLRRALGEPAFSAGVRPFEGEGRDRARFGLLVLDDRGACTFLDERGLCTLHARLGPDILCDTCALYPRSPALIGDRRELSMVLSCPESARLALLAEDATDLVELPPGLFPDDRARARVLPADSSAAVFDEVRGAALELLARRTYPIASRLASTLALCTEVNDLLASPGVQAAALRAVVARFEDDAVLEALHRGVARAATDDALPAHFCIELLAARLARRTQPSFARVAMAAFEGCTAEGGRRVEVAAAPGVAPGILHVSRSAVVAVHRRRRAALPGPLAERLEVCFENYAKAHWFDGWFLDAPSLSAYAQVLVLRVAVLRFLVLAHPGVAAAGALLAAGDDEAALRAFDAAVVECTFAFSRAIEHQEGLVEDVMKTMEKAELTSLHEGLSLIRF
jgi:lysine-N-methylase